LHINGLLLLLLLLLLPLLLLLLQDVWNLNDPFDGLHLRHLSMQRHRHLLHRRSRLLARLVAKRLQVQALHSGDPGQ
jgi:hypothetical protein